MTFQTLKAGDHLEYLTAAVFQGNGYLVRRSVPLQVSEDVTDIDIFGIKFLKPFQSHRIICDCKDKQRSKPYERIFWSKGLASFVKASETYVILPSASWKVIDFARSGQVRVMTKQVLNEAFQRIYGEKKTGIGLANEAFYEPFYQRLFPFIKKEFGAEQALNLSRSLFLSEDPYVSLNVAISELRRVASILKTIETSSEPRFHIWRYIAADLIVVSSLLLLYVASDTISMTPLERKIHITDRLTYGDISPSKAKEIFSLAKELGLQSVRMNLSPEDRQNLRSYDIGEITPPDYAADICGLVDRAIQSPNIYNELPQLLDFLLFEQLLQDKTFSDETYKQLFSPYLQQERLKVARNILSFVKTTCDLNISAFWQKEDVSASVENKVSIENKEEK